MQTLLFSLILEIICIIQLVIFTESLSFLDSIIFLKPSQNLICILCVLKPKHSDLEFSSTATL